jgi:hypothetical protein
VKTIKTLLAAVLAVVFIFSPVFAGYREDIINGNTAYKAGKWAEADAWYKSAYKEKPSDKLKALIAAVEKKAGTEESPPVKAVETVKAAGKTFDAGPLLLITADVLLAGGAGFMVYYSDNAQKEYSESYAELNNTTQANYDLLVKKQKETYAIMTAETAVLSLAAVALIYTFGDAFVTHGIFKQDVSVNTGIKQGLASIQIGRRF